jgi:hypothetical protein
LRSGAYNNSQQGRPQDHHYHDGNANKRPRLSQLSAPRNSKTNSTPVTSSGHQLEKKSLFQNRNSIGNKIAPKNDPQSNNMVLETIDITSDEDMADEDFTKNARKQRERDDLFDTPESPLPPVTRARKIGEAISSYFLPEHHSTPRDLRKVFDTPQKTRKVPGAFEDDSESPDALQNDEQPLRRDPVEGRRPLQRTSSIWFANRINGSVMAGSTRSQATGRTTMNIKKSTNHTFPLKGFRFGRYPESEDYVFVIDKGERSFTINIKDSLLDNEPLFNPIRLDKVNKVLIGKDPSHKMIVYLSTDNTKGAITNAANPQMRLDLGSRKPLSDLALLMEEFGIQIHNKEPYVDALRLAVPSDIS